MGSPGRRILSSLADVALINDGTLQSDLTRCIVVVVVAEELHEVFNALGLTVINLLFGLLLLTNPLNLDLPQSDLLKLILFLLLFLHNHIQIFL